MADGEKSVLLVPAGGKGGGLGHLDRCLSFSGTAGIAFSISVEFLDDAARSFLRERLRGGALLNERRVIDTRSESGAWDFVLMDKRSTTTEELRRFARLGTIICLDEGGPARRLAPFIVDAMPSPAHAEPPNISSLSFLDLPERQRTGVPARIDKVLITFGGEDRADLSGAFLEAVIPAGIFGGAELTAVQGPLFLRNTWPRQVRVVRDIPLDREMLCGFDLVVTHFGLTALRAMALGIPVILLNPSRYHRALSRRTGIPEIGVGKADMRSLAGLLKDPGRLQRAIDGFERSRYGTARGGLMERLRGMGRGTGSACPGCGRGWNAAVARFEDRTYFYCGECGIHYLESFRAGEKSYDSAYFEEEYKKQYGKTYLEDFRSIKTAGFRRIERIRRLLGRTTGGTVVDIGCAYGPFLDALRDAGFTPVGVDISREAVDFVNNSLGMEAVQSDFQGLELRMLPRQPMRALTLWYVLEHLRGLDEALSKAGALLMPGGVLAFSTPSGSGISARRNMRRFLENSPGDHFTVLSPRVLRRFLRRYGFELKIIRITGHHPERFPAPFDKIRSALGKRILRAVSVLFRLGDTFEAYAVKRRSA